MEIKSKTMNLIEKVRELRLGEIWDKLKKPFNFCWKAGLAVIGIAFVIALAGEIYDYYTRIRYGRNYWWKNEDLSKNIEIHHFKKGRVATYDVRLKKIVSPKLRWISSTPERDSLTVFCDKDGKRGFLNVNTGQVVIKGTYKRAWHFSEGLAAVMTEDNKIGFINYNNEIVIPAEYDYIDGCEYIFKNGFCVVMDKDTFNEGAIDTKGRIVIPIEFDDISLNTISNTWTLSKDNKYGLADENMNIVFEPVYKRICVNGSKREAYLTKDGVKQLVSFDGEVILPFVIDEAWPLEYTANSQNGEGTVDILHPFLMKVMVDYNCYGVMDSRTGKMIIPAIYTDIKLASKDQIMAEVDGDEENNLLFTTSGVMIK